MTYLDYCATTPIAKEVYEAMIPYLTLEYGNPSSKYYKLAASAKEAVEESRLWVAKLINTQPQSIVFTSGATESTNMIIKGIADYQKLYTKKGNHIITSMVEHKATLNTCKFLNGELYSNKDSSFSITDKILKVDRGYEVTFLEVNKYAQVEPENLLDNIKNSTILVSLIWGNNEIGTINDILKLAEISHSKMVPIHSDATQVIAKIDVDVEKTKVDFLSFSAHKLNGPKGVGAAYIREDDFGLPPISSLIHGGEQENGLRAGTLAVHNIVGFGKAAEIVIRDKAKNQQHYLEIDREINSLLKKIEGIEILGDPDNKLPGILSLIIKNEDFNNERFIKKISDKYCLSSGSACTAGQPSHVLKAIGLENMTGNVLRISYGTKTSKSEIMDALNFIINNI
ncbi:MAG: cysteine desulfurase family protein [Bacteroidota bacterium]